MGEKTKGRQWRIRNCDKRRKGGGWGGQKKKEGGKAGTVKRDGRWSKRRRKKNICLKS